jgi:hypothetical protein
MFIIMLAPPKGIPATKSSRKTSPTRPATTMPTIVIALDMGDPTCNRDANGEDSVELNIVCRNSLV